MDKEQAIEKLNDIRCHVKETSAEEEALVMAIEALKKQLTKEGTTKGTTSELIDRQAAIDIERNATVDTNPSHFEAHQKFTQFMDDAEISSFGRWQWSNGFNTALTAVGIDLKKLPPAQPEPPWISVTERLPDNADHPGAFCPRYQVVTPYGVTEGWYRPHDHEKGGQWFALFWFMSQIYEIWNIDFERGDVPKVIGEAPVMEWRPLPEPYKPNKKQRRTNEGCTT